MRSVLCVYLLWCGLFYINRIPAKLHQRFTVRSPDGLHLHQGIFRVVVGRVNGLGEDGELHHHLPHLEGELMRDSHRIYLQVDGCRGCASVGVRVDVVKCGFHWKLAFAPNGVLAAQISELSTRCAPQLHSKVRSPSGPAQDGPGGGHGLPRLHGELVPLPSTVQQIPLPVVDIAVNGLAQLNFRGIRHRKATGVDLNIRQQRETRNEWELRVTGLITIDHLSVYGEVDGTGPGRHYEIGWTRRNPKGYTVRVQQTMPDGQRDRLGRHGYRIPLEKKVGRTGGRAAVELDICIRSGPGGFRRGETIRHHMRFTKRLGEGDSS